MTPTPRTSPVSVRPSARSYQEYVNQQQCVLAAQQNERMINAFPGPQLWRQMMIGFTCAGSVGLTMLVLGTIFIAGSVSEQQPITVMLCVMGIVFGIIIIAGTIILGRLLITRKWDKCTGRGSSPSQCFHTCSIIYSPSIDQMGSGVQEGSNVEPPPSYSSLHPLSQDPAVSAMSVYVDGEAGTVFSSPSVMIELPKYEEVNHPLPEYQEKSEKNQNSSLPPYEER